jgi:hypothetical protein
MAEKLRKAMCFVLLTHGVLNLDPGAFSKFYRTDMDAYMTKRLGMPYFIIPIPNKTDTVESHNDLQLGSEKNKDYWRPLSHIVDPVESLEGYEVLLRSFLGGNLTRCSLDKIEHLGGRNAVTKADMDVVERWPNHILPEAVQRRIRAVKASDLQSVVGDYAIEGRVFAKTAVKEFQGNGIVMDADEFLVDVAKSRLPYRGIITEIGKEPRIGTLYSEITPDTEIIISQPMSLQSDDKGTMEYRTWVVNGRVAVIDRYLKGVVEKPPAEVAKFAEFFVKNHSSRLPAHYVVDIGLSENRPVVIEMGTIMESGGTNNRIFRRILRTYDPSLSMLVRTFIDEYRDNHGKIQYWYGRP